MKNKWSFIKVILIIAVLVASQNNFAENTYRKIESAHEFTRPVSKQIQDENAFVCENLKRLVLKARLQHEMNRPEILIPEFLRSYKNLSREQKSQICLSRKSAGITCTESVGMSVNGKVTVQGNLPDHDILVLAFDGHGYFAGQGSVSLEDGRYSIADLMPGSYYIMTQNQVYVDEIYNNITTPLADRATWRSAETVIIADADKDNIDFDLANGATLSGTIFMQDGTTQLDDETALLSVTGVENEFPIFETQIELTDGSYEFVIPTAGAIKISATIDGFQKTWHTGQDQWSSGQIVIIPSYDSRVENLDFNMLAQLPGQEKGMITGNISPALLGIAYAIDLSDTSFAGLGVKMPFKKYQIKNLKPGNYIVYGNDYFGNLTGLSSSLGLDNNMGEYYNNKLLPDLADTVTVLAGQTTEGISFSLDDGGSISGSVTTTEGVPVDSLMIFCFHADLLGDGEDPFMTRLQIAACMTDKNGNYSIKGLPAGDYILRTLSAFAFYIDIADLAQPIKSGKHAGKIVDEYYRSIYNLLLLEKATRVPVSVAQETKNIEFVLAQPCFIHGRISDAVTDQPDTNITLIAFADTAAYPFLATTRYQETGEYTLGPIPSGRYKILALSGIKNNSVFLSEFHDGKRTYSSASVMDVYPPLLDRIHFTLDRGGVIQGFVDLTAGSDFFPAGADTLENIPIIAFDAVTGKTVNYDFIQFNGGYRINRLQPGNYKAMVLPILQPFAATYCGGGASFDDPLTENIRLEYGQTEERNIELQTATGSIAGNVFESGSDVPLSRVLVIAYEPSGHAASCAMTDYDLFSATKISENGSFQIHGLRTGTYYLRTFSLSTLSDALQLVPFVMNLGESLDLLGLLQGGLPDISLNFNTYQDIWHSGISAQISMSLDELVTNASSYGVPISFENALFPVYMPIPFAQTIPAQATPVNVVNGETSQGIQLYLTPGSLGDNITVETGIRNNRMPEQFVIQQNYPNPFNPHTTITLFTAQICDIKIDIYNALGRHVKTLLNRRVPQSRVSVTWQGDDEMNRAVASGIYFAEITFGQESIKTLKMLLIK